MFEIRLSQGAKPGKGGILPAIKVTAEIAAIRGIPAGEDSISPNRHVEIERPGNLLDMIARIRSVRVICSGKLITPSGVGAVHGCGFYCFGAWFHVCAGLHSGHAVQ